MTTKLEKLLARIASLQKENAALNEENKRLRRYLVAASEKIADLDGEISDMKAGESI